MSDAILNFTNDVSIDLDDLHNEWARHPYIRKKYADEVAHLEREVKQKSKEVDLQKSKLKAAASKAVLRIKEENPKFTVQQVDAAMADAEETEGPEEVLRTLQSELINMEYDLNIAKNALKAMDDRRAALENEVQLWKADYYSAPSERRQAQSAKILPMEDEIADATVSDSRNEVNRRRRSRE